MDVKVHNEKTYDLLGLTETQAKALLAVCLDDTELVRLDICDGGEHNIADTLNTTRQTLINAGVRPIGVEND